MARFNGEVLSRTLGGSIGIDTSISRDRTSLVLEDVRSQCGGAANHGFNFTPSGSCRFHISDEVVVSVFGLGLDSEGNIRGPGGMLNGSAAFQFVRCDGIGIWEVSRRTKAMGSMHPVMPSPIQRYNVADVRLILAAAPWLESHEVNGANAQANPILHSA